MQMINSPSRPTKLARSSSDGFSPLQWLVIAIGGRPGSIPLQWSELGQALLALADCDDHPGPSPCLEALRRASSLAVRCGWNMPAVELGAFLQAGWSEAQFETLIESVDGTAPCESEQWSFDIGGGGLSAEQRCLARRNFAETRL